MVQHEQPDHDYLPLAYRRIFGDLIPKSHYTTGNRERETMEYQGCSPGAHCDEPCVSFSSPSLRSPHHLRTRSATSFS